MSGHLTAPRPLGRHASTGALPQMRRHPLPRTTRRSRPRPTPAAARDRHAGLWHATAGCPATDGLARLLARRAQAPTAITVRRLRSQRRETRVLSISAPLSADTGPAPVVGIQAAAPTSPHVTPPRHRPGRRVAGNARVLHRAVGEKTGALLPDRTRQAPPLHRCAPLQAFCVLGGQGTVAAHALGGVPLGGPPCPAPQPLGIAPRVRAASATPSPWLGTRRTAACVHSSVY